MTKSQSLERGLNVMELLNASTEPMGPREIARKLDLSPAIVQRLLNTLAERHYIRRDPATKRYSIGYQVLGIGAALMSRDAMLLEARQELQALTDRMRLDAYLAVLQDTAAMYLLCLQGKGPVTVKVQPGHTIRLHTTAIGKVILASFPDEKALQLMGPGPLERLTPKTVTDPQEVVASLNGIRAAGYAVVEDEQITGVSSVGALVGQRDGETRTAISVAFSRHFSPELELDQVIREVAGAAERITQRLRYPAE